MSNRLAVRLLRVASALDARGLVRAADEVEWVAVRVSNMSDLSGAPMMNAVTQNVQQTGLGKSLGLTSTPGQGYYGRGPEQAMRGPQLRPGMSSQEVAQAQLAWYNSPEVRAWYANQGNVANQQYGDYYSKMGEMGQGGQEAAQAQYQFGSPGQQGQMDVSMPNPTMFTVPPLT
jgi:hypothetical protein